MYLMTLFALSSTLYEVFSTQDFLLTRSTKVPRPPESISQDTVHPHPITTTTTATTSSARFPHDAIPGIPVSSEFGQFPGSPSVTNGDDQYSPPNRRLRTGRECPVPRKEGTVSQRPSEDTYGRVRFSSPDIETEI